MLPLIFLVIGIFAQQIFADEPEAIVGGTAAAPREFPHQCSLRYRGSHICGCSIIGSTKILTAAHCTDDLSPSSLRVATGTLSITGGEIHEVKTIVEHPQYSRRVQEAWKNDIAVITLKSPINFNENQKPIALATSRPKAGEQCTLSGWGQISTNGPPSRVLLKMTQQILPQNDCQNQHRTMPLTGSHLCAINRYGIGVCSGDSGGPLISNGVQIGLTSWGLPCAQGKPDVYTDVAYHLDFIKRS
ncbi:hypothetical protein PUN28_013525 [Cardiocondyla obscurior]|uniref:chymotrypsin n=1 Tax=Cardiocondyla obscurior TaxID=286306 RepID=A0AAW2F6T4_9HYME